MSSERVVTATGAGGAPESAVLELESTLTIAEVARERERFAASLDGVSGLAVDAGELETVDGAGLQLLAALVKTARENATTLCWRRVPDVLVRNAAVFGVAGALALPAAGDGGEPR